MKSYHLVLRSFDSGQPAQRQQRWRRAHSWSLWDWLDGPSFIVVRMLCICLKSGQFAITAVLPVATKGHKQCWWRPAASLENHRGRNINYINRYINSHSAYLYRYQQCITVVYSYATHVRVQFMNVKYIMKSHRLCKSEAMLLCVFCKNGFTILNVEYSEHNVPVWLCLLKWAHSTGFYLLSVSRESDGAQNAAGQTSDTMENISDTLYQLSKTSKSDLCRVLKFSVWIRQSRIRLLVTQQHGLVLVQTKQSRVPP